MRHHTFPGWILFSLMTAFALFLAGVAGGQVPSASTSLPTFAPVPIDTVAGFRRVSGRTFSVAIDQGAPDPRHVYLGVEGRLMVVDVSKNQAPKVVGQTPILPADGQDLVVSGGLAFMAAGQAGLLVIDVSDPTSPGLVSSHPTVGRARAVILTGSHALVADDWAGLRSFDVSDPLRLVAAGGILTDAPVLDIFVDGSYAYAATGEGGLLVVDVSNPEEPIVVGSVSLPGHATGVFVRNDHAYVAAGGAGLRIVDVSDPRAPFEAGAFEAGFVRRVFVLGQRAYLATERTGLRLLDVSNPFLPTILTSYRAVGSANDVVVAGNRSFVADGVGGLMVTVSRSSESLARASSTFLPIGPNARLP
jgi:hypothetical protein